MKHLLILLVVAFSTIGPAAAQAARISDGRGKVQFKEAGGSKWSPAALMTMLGKGAQVKVEAGGQATLSFTKNS